MRKRGHVKDWSRSGWIKLVRSEETHEILGKDPLAFALLTHIALRARWGHSFNVHGLTQGEALIGDYRNMATTRREYRSRLAWLEEWGFVTTRATSKGTVVTLNGGKGL